MKKTENLRFSKKHLRIVLGNISRDTLNRKFKILKSEIEKQFPHYRDNDQLLSGKMFNWICDQIGPEQDEILKKFQENFGLNKNNKFLNGD